MAFDGITVRALTEELKAAFTGTRIYKIAQTESDELILTIKGNSATKKLLLSADASLPLVYITDDSKQAPLNAPGFCMLLRKHLSNAKIMDISQPSLERVIRFSLEHLDEMGDLKTKYLVVELMGKHSNIIFLDENDMIIDAIKHVSHNVSSVREVLPGREYFIPGTTDKLDALDEDSYDFEKQIEEAHMECAKAIYSSFTGFSPVVASEICHRAGIDADASTSSLSKEDVKKLKEEFSKLISTIKASEFGAYIYYDGNTPSEYAPIPLSMYSDMTTKTADSISSMLNSFYKEKSVVVRIRQKSSDLRKITQTALERNVKKLDLQRKQLQDTEKKDKYKVYGELINAYGYSVPLGSSSFATTNYYTGEEITIPLDPTISAIENGKKYFEKYSKLKRTAQNLTTIIEEVAQEVEHLKSVMTALDIAVLEEDLQEIKEELIASGYIRFKSNGKKTKITSKPFHYVSSDGFHIYVGKNNLQNDKLTFEMANGNDWWFHAKKMPGSHVVVKTEGKELPDRTFEEAARLAAYYSAGRKSESVEIDYTLKKNVKKPAKAKPGFVVYYTNYSMVISTNISIDSLTQLS